MSYIVAYIAYACLLVLLLLYAVWDALVVLLFALRSCIEVVVLLVSVLLSSTDASLRCMPNTTDATVWSVTKYEARKMVTTLRRDLWATLMTPKFIQEMTR